MHLEVPGITDAQFRYTQGVCAAYGLALNMEETIRNGRRDDDDEV